MDSTRLVSNLNLVVLWLSLGVQLMALKLNLAKLVDTAQLIRTQWH